jgi:hypothetical protein
MISPTVNRVRLLALALGSALLLAPLAASGQEAHRNPQSELELHQRVAYQRAIEAVYWRHRIWPKENREPKPALDSVMPLSVIEAKVEEFLRKSEALALYWNRPITAGQLQAEMDRMARQTKQPEILGELWQALGNDPYLIAECLARPALANRLIRAWYARDERYHGELKARAEAELRAYGTVAQMRRMSGEYRELEGDSEVRELGDTGEVSRLQEEEGEFYVTAVLESSESRMKVARVAWKKEPFEAWWKQARWEAGLRPAEQEYAYRLPDLASGTCTDDTWRPTAVPQPVSRSGHTAVWTGSEMIVWGGRNDNLGERYDPATDTWLETSTSSAPSARSRHTAVWTGSEMIVWGGCGDSSCVYPTNFGGRYDPATDTWVAMSTVNAPSARASHTAVWTDGEMIVWGGCEYRCLPLTNTGGRYDPATDTWAATSTVDAPSVRSNHTAVWADGEMIVWGGCGGSCLEAGRPRGAGPMGKELAVSQPVGAHC